MIYLLHCRNSSFEKVGATHFEEDNVVRDIKLLTLHVGVTGYSSVRYSDLARELQSGVLEDESKIGLQAGIWR